MMDEIDTDMSGPPWIVREHIEHRLAPLRRRIAELDLEIDEMKRQLAALREQ